MSQPTTPGEGGAPPPADGPVDLVDLAAGWSATMTAAGAARLPSELTEPGLPTRLPQHLGTLFPDADLDERDVWLRCELELEQPGLSRLILEHLGPIAELFIDDQPQLSTRNLFRGYAHDLALDAGRHRLAICLRSPARALASDFASATPVASAWLSSSIRAVAR